MILLALLAIIVPLVMLVLLNLPARVGMSISAIVVTIVAFSGWEMLPLAIGASVAQGIHRALTIGLILFGAITLLKVLEETQAINRIRLGLYAISTDMRVQTVIVAFAFISVLEGVSGFGTPMIITAPLLVALGFQPLAAASLTLLGDTVANTFGAVATPLLIGLGNVPNFSADLALLVGAQVTLFDLLMGTLVPLALVTLLIFMFSRQTRRQKWIALREIAPWALLIGATYAVSALLVVRLIGIEFVSIISGIIALTVATITAKNGWLTPKNIWRHHGHAKTLSTKMSKKDKEITLWKAWSPYGVMIGLLLLSRTIEPIEKFLTSAIDAGWHNIFGVEGISSTWAILYSPGVILFTGAIFGSFFIAKSIRPLLSASKKSLITTGTALSALIPTLIMVQIFINSGFNTADLVSMPVYIGHTLANIFGEFWAIVAPWLGGVGAFIAGSSTVSTLTMAPVQYSIATDAGLPVIVILALQMAGAAAGNAIAIHNIVSASTVVGLHHKEGVIIHKLMLPSAIYMIIAGSLGMLVVWLA